MSRLFVDISQEVEFPVYDEEKQCYFTHTGTIGELLQYFTDYRNIIVYQNTFIKWGIHEEIQKK